MNQRPTIREQMDACRADSDDLHLSEHAADLAELHAGLRENAEARGDCERIQHDDRLIRSAMHDVALPAGLEAKLLASVQAVEGLSLAGVRRAIEEGSSTEEKPVTVPAPANRRLFIKVASGVVAASVVAGAFAFLNWPPKEQATTKDQLATQVEEWLRAVDVTAMTKPTKPMSPPGGVLGTVAGSSSILSRQGKMTAYSLKLRGISATLLAIPTSQQYPVNALPFTKISGMSGGWQVGAWQREGVLYVIAVLEDSGARLDQFAPPQPVG